MDRTRMLLEDLIVDTDEETPEAPPAEKTDEEKFMEASTPATTEEGEPSSPAERRNHGGMGRDAEDDLLDDEADEAKKFAKGHSTQYTRMGPGFSPVGPTIKSVPTGVYRIVVLANGAIIYAPKKIVTDNLLRLPDSKSDMVIEEIEKFWGLKSTYQKYGFVHKRGFLLWGPPGSGKTSTTAMIIKQMVDRGGTIFLMDTHPTHMANALAEFRQVEPDRPCVVIMEDIDTIINSYSESEVLALLDGESSIDNVVFVATTNYPEELDGRIVNRPSRFDRIVLIDMPNEEARRLYLKKRGLIGDDEIDKWVELTENFSIAHMKELIVGVKCLGQPLAEVSSRLRKMFSKVSKGGGIGFGPSNE